MRKDQYFIFLHIFCSILYFLLCTDKAEQQTTALIVSEVVSSRSADRQRRLCK